MSTGNFNPSAPPGDPSSSNLFLSAIRFLLSLGARVATAFHSSRLATLFRGGRQPDR